MVDPFEILPILVLALAIVCIPLLSDGPSIIGRRRAQGGSDRAGIEEQGSRGCGNRS